MEGSIKLSIVTPTILRSSLKKAIDSISKQEFKEYEHLVMVDGVADISKYPRGKTQNIYVKKPFTGNDFGNYARHIGTTRTVGEYTIYLDDDNTHVKDSLSILWEAIEKANYPIWGVFPITRMGERFLYNPGISRTDINQVFHRTYAPDGSRITFPPYKMQTTDGIFVESLMQKFPAFVKLDVPELVIYNKMNYGNFY